MNGYMHIHTYLYAGIYIYIYMYLCIYIYHYIYDDFLDLVNFVALSVKCVTQCLLH